MTKPQQFTVASLQSQGFKITETLATAVRLERGADLRIVMCDGTQKRSQHQGRTYKGNK